MRVEKLMEEGHFRAQIPIGERGKRRAFRPRYYGEVHQLAGRPKAGIAKDTEGHEYAISNPGGAFYLRTGRGWSGADTRVCRKGRTEKSDNGSVCLAPL